MESKGYAYQVQYESRFGGDKIDYVVANNEAEVRAMFADKIIDYVAESAYKVDFNASKSEIMYAINRD